MAVPVFDRLIELLAINRVIAAATDANDLPDLVVRRTADFLRADTVVLLLADDESQATVAASVGLSPQKARSFVTPLDERLGGRLCELIACAPDHFVAAPVIESGTVRGVLAAFRRDQVFDDDSSRMPLIDTAEHFADDRVDLQFDRRRVENIHHAASRTVARSPSEVAANAAKLSRILLECDQ